MVKVSRPFTDKYLRYVISWLLFGLFGSLYMWQWSWIYGIASLLVAFCLSFGLDLLYRYIVKSKVRAMVNEEPLVVVDAIRLKRERRGYLVVTDSFVLFVPVFRKIKTVVEIKQIVRIESERLGLEIIAKLPNNYHVFSFALISSKKFLPVLKELTGESLPYKYDRLHNHSI
ncbi:MULTISPECIES: hypothetical protein [Bacillaceae]|uniref:Uncharacterized protein n=1 Tax=Evansella alkalicola TaxID=745819 RepID=A0ABS6K0M5_9BACI|nr:MULTISPECIES: hypothetical protein [Bacillaceae]MBU9724278.1 hypothetical protein [Bacillus alkalicola]